jgi:hypothetical protein
LPITQGDLKPVGYLPVGVSAVIGEGDRLALHLGEPVQAAPHPLAVQARLHRLGHLVVRRADLGGPLLTAGRRRGGPDTVDGAAVGYGQHPRRRATNGRVEPSGGPPYLEEHLLCYLLGLRRIPENPADDAVDRAGKPVVHRLERVRVAARHVDEQVVEVPLSPPIRGRRLEPGRVRIARVHMSPSKQTPDRMGETRPNFR